MLEQLKSNRVTLRSICQGLEELEGQMRSAQSDILAAGRGYFSPAQDDFVRQLLLSYRNYRLALYDITYRYMDYASIPEEELRLQAFLVGYTAALTLYNKSLILVQTYKDNPVVRAKLNEPEQRFGIDAGFFEEIYERYADPDNYRQLQAAHAFFDESREAFERHGLAENPGYEWTFLIIEKCRPATERDYVTALKDRFVQTWESLLARIEGPVMGAAYDVQAWVSTLIGDISLRPWREPTISHEQVEAVKQLIEPGDIILTKHEYTLTAKLLPGWWPHGAIYVGARQQLTRMGLDRRPEVRARLGSMGKDDENRAMNIIEAMAEGVIFNPLEETLHADQAVVLRPMLSESDLRDAIVAAFSHQGKPYDFEFDFTRSDRLVCTEVIYRSYDDRGPIAFVLQKRMGRFTLTADDISRAFFEGYDARGDPRPRRPFDFVCILFTGEDDEKATFSQGREGIKLYRSTLDG